MTPSEPPANVPQSILVAEDLSDARDSLQQLLHLSLNLDVDVAADGAIALEMLRKKSYSVLITDLRMPKKSGLDLIQAIQDERLPVTCIVTTGHGDVQDAVQAMRLGAYDFLTKGYNPQHLLLLVQRALSERALRDEVIALRSQLQGRHSFQNVLSKSPKMADLFDLISNISDTSSTVLILGETGTGKEQIGRAIHQASSKIRPGAFVAVNCAALPETLLESELFGHEKGSFTGALAQRKGRFEQAQNGTLFLDEIGDVPLSMQVKLLRVLQERRIERVGGTTSIDIDVRVIAATHQPIEKLVKEGKFREDLYYRLNVIRIEIPPLRERPEDIPVLAEHFLAKFARPGQNVTITPEAMQVLLKYDWAGNVRQLENAIERACVTARDGVIRPNNLPSDVARQNESKHPLQVDLSRPLAEQLAQITAHYEERYLRKALRKTRGHVGKCATISGLSRRSVTDKIAHYKIDKAQFKQD
ncbi:sigma-54-dependent transcriptional regulator [Limnoglobus roseus]|uniref:Sigma-54-dependent Fis family transcriptional regulator n=1 Tax=Limnoglobus roseus TaxID=2598579 RepID=A0A5C1AE44_9BACT|nr:sigma-54 dependent transcriptional regulator [Limnoglobus roseus]QEL16467.1 sigma-54-dependent Fis family transcriptional regulator [Limnoglobus roseus]